MSEEWTVAFKINDKEVKSLFKVASRAFNCGYFEVRALFGMYSEGFNKLNKTECRLALKFYSDLIINHISRSKRAIHLSAKRGSQPQFHEMLTKTGRWKIVGEASCNSNIRLDQKRVVTYAIAFPFDSTGGYDGTVKTPKEVIEMYKMYSVITDASVKSGQHVVGW